MHQIRFALLVPGIVLFYGCQAFAALQVPDETCGEDQEAYNSFTCLDPAALFASIAGDEPVLQSLGPAELGHVSATAGGELRWRYMDERNRLRKGGPGHSQYQLWRFTPWVQLNVGEMIGGYVQAIDASMFGLDAPYSAAPIDENRADLLQLYGEVRLPGMGEVQTKYRYGRQFLQYGNQRLLSPLGWANTYRNFEGHKLMLTSPDWDLDLFSMHSLNAAAGNVPRPASFDRADQSRSISGAWSTWKGFEQSTVDLYWLFSNESDSSPDLMDGRRQTLGSRYAGRHRMVSESQLAGTWNLDAEAAWQFGRDDFGSVNRDKVQAGMAASTGGYTFDELPWTPGLGGIFWWGSGGRGNDGTIHTFHSLYPLGHAWWGQIDNFSGQNLVDYGVQASLAPTKKVSVVTQWHWFDLASRDDRIYTITGTALPGSGDRRIGNELDLVGNWNISRTLQLQAGWLWFFYGDAVNRGPLARSDAEQLYLQVTWAF